MAAISKNTCSRGGEIKIVCLLFRENCKLGEKKKKYCRERREKERKRKKIM